MVIEKEHQELTQSNYYEINPCKEGIFEGAIIRTEKKNSLLKLQFREG
jgi:hypothetical protein